MGAWKAVESVWQDARYACRRLRKERTFALAALLTIALAVALNTAIFSVANAVWLRPLALHEPDRLVAIERPYFANFLLKTWASGPSWARCLLSSRERNYALVTPRRSRGQGIPSRTQPGQPFRGSPD